MDLLQEERPRPIDGGQTETDMFLKVLKLLKEVGVTLTEQIDHFQNGVLVSTVLQPRPKEILVALHRGMEARHKAIDGFEIIVKNKRPSSGRVELRDMVQLLLSKVGG